MNFLCHERFLKIKVRNFNFGDVFLVKHARYSIRKRRAEFFFDTDVDPVKHGVTSLTPAIINIIESQYCLGLLIFLALQKPP
jgi:hypothetical protein